MKLITLPFHWVHPSAPAKYVGCRAAIAVYDPYAPAMDKKRVKEARLRIFSAAVGSVRGKKYDGTKRPRTVLVPTMFVHMTWKDFGRGRDLSKVSLEHLGFRRFKVADLETMPFANCPSKEVPKKTLKMLEKLYGQA